MSKNIRDLSARLRKAAASAGHILSDTADTMKEAAELLDALPSTCLEDYLPYEKKKALRAGRQVDVTRELQAMIDAQPEPDSVPANAEDLSNMLRSLQNCEMSVSRAAPAQGNVVAVLHEALGEAARKLRQYEALHRAKGTEDSNAKAEVNADLAGRFELILATTERAANVAAPAQGELSDALPELPPAMDAGYLGYGELVYDAEQMHAYAKQYAALCLRGQASDAADEGALEIACVINRKLGDALLGRSYLLPDDLASLQRFYECATDFDSGGHDVAKDVMARLCEIGVVRSKGFGRHETTSFGDYVLERAEGEPVKLPLKTLVERNADAARAAQSNGSQDADQA